MSYQYPSTPEERINAARGYKAALHNEHVSPEATKHAQEMLQRLNEQEALQELSGESVHVPYHRHERRSSGDERSRSLQERISAARGYKVYSVFSSQLIKSRAIHNPLVSEEGKQHAWDMLQVMDDEEARQELYHQQERPKDPPRIAVGLKAQGFPDLLLRTLSNTNFSAQRNPLVSEDGRCRAAKHLHDIENNSSAEYHQQGD
ncbi:uncharacterized protein N7496_002124 [Penicillium cataractarum]|uniref:Uncharacterized protein n=1 Tax=Penicillium cataractarum TaxID=2100454 RepID=A0A9W9SJF8_9EURO|nr:uncharacterized protein N7496_002124 [Penicillium cataractarum]KAJ5379696.1 hypothetical protein N7496_002124 [Penicillium cataractarum]